MRLVGGEGRCKGTLEGKRDAEWRPLSDVWNFWRPEDSAEVCEQLGCGNLISASRLRLPKSQRVWELSTNCDRTGSSFCKSWTEGGSTSVITVSCSGNSSGTVCVCVYLSICPLLFMITSLVRILNVTTDLSTCF